MKDSSISPMNEHQITFSQRFSFFLQICRTSDFFSKHAYWSFHCFYSLHVFSPCFTHCCQNQGRTRGQQLMWWSIGLRSGTRWGQLRPVNWLPGRFVTWRCILVEVAIKRWMLCDLQQYLESLLRPKKCQGIPSIVLHHHQPEPLLQVKMDLCFCVFYFSGVALCRHSPFAVKAGVQQPIKKHSPFDLDLLQVFGNVLDKNFLGIITEPIQPPTLV